MYQQNIWSWLSLASDVRWLRSWGLANTVLGLFAWSHFLDSGCLLFLDFGCTSWHAEAFHLTCQVEFKLTGTFCLRIFLIRIFEVAKSDPHLNALLEVIKVTCEVSSDKGSQDVAHSVVGRPVSAICSRLIVVGQVLPANLGKSECRIEHTTWNALKRLIQRNRCYGVADRVVV